MTRRGDAEAKAKAQGEDWVLALIDTWAAGAEGRSLEEARVARVIAHDIRATLNKVAETAA